MADPWEQVNLAIEARHRATLHEYRQWLRAWCLANDDLRFARRIHGDDT